MDNITSKEKECLAYFKQSPVWNKLFCGFREKYASYGALGGTVVLGRLSAEDIDTLEGFFGRSYHGQKSASVSAERFRRALLASRFAEIAPERILELYFEEPLIAKKERIRQIDLEREHILEAFQNAFADTPASQAAQSLAEIVKGQMHKGLEEWERSLYLSARIYNALPYREQKKAYLPVFAARLTGNPHAFDRGTADGHLLYQVISLDLQQRGKTVEANAVFQSYQRQKSYFASGILLDDVSNYAMVYGIRAKKRDGREHIGMAGFLQENEMLQVPLAVLADWESVECPNGRMYIVENPSIFSMLCDGADQSCAYMCMNGQPRLAGLLLLDLLAKSGTKLSYAGDLDPEGLLIAQKLWEYYPGKFSFWHMGPEDYEKSRSEESISEKRLKMLDRIYVEELLPVKEQLLREKRAAYQERIWD